MISIYQGNDKSLHFFRKFKNGNIIKTVPQNLWFTVRNKNDAVVIQKTIDNGIAQKEDGSWEIAIVPSDTQPLKVGGDYYCDVKVKNEIGKEYTIVKTQTFRIMKVATHTSSQGE